MGTRIIQYREKGINEVPKEENLEISGNINNAQIVSEEHKNDEVGVEDITKNEFYESVMCDDENRFKFYQKYSYWSPEQLVVEIKNNVWFQCKLSDVTEERQLLNLKCPSPKLLTLNQKENKKTFDFKKTFNKWMWQIFVKGLGGSEYKQLSVFPDLNNEQTKEFYAFMEEFHNSWVPDIEHEESLQTDDEEEDTTMW